MANTNNFNKTPLLQNMRKEGGTLYVFPSASEDIGLNLNTRANSVSLSHYALLNIPISDTEYPVSTKAFLDDWEDEELMQKQRKYVMGNHFNPTLINGHFQHVYNGTSSSIENGEQSASWHIAASLQNYAMNFETVLMNQASYNFSEAATVSERVFFKWLKETGAIRWKHSFGTQDIPTLHYFEEGDAVLGDDTTNLYNSVVKCFGKIDAGNNVAGEFGVFNETYVNIPTSYGGGKVFFTSKADKNYSFPNRYFADLSLLEGRAEDNNSRVYTVNTPFTDLIPTEANSGTGVLKYEYYNESHEEPAVGSWYHADGFSGSGSTGFYVTQDAGKYDKYKPYKGIQINPLITTGANCDYLTDELQITYQPNGDKAYDKAMTYRYRRSKLDGVEIVKNLTVIQKIWDEKFKANNETEVPTISSWDDVNTNANLSLEKSFEFNTILLYYSIYNATTGQVEAINLFGVLFLDAPKNIESDSAGTGVNTKFNIPTKVKRKTDGKTAGTGFSFKINLKTLSVYDNADAIINDNTTSSSITSIDFSEAIYNLNRAVDALNVNVDTTKAITRQYAELIALYSNTQLSVNDLSTKLNSYVHGNHSSVLNTSVLNTNQISGHFDDTYGNNSNVCVRIPIEIDENEQIVYSENEYLFDASSFKAPQIDASIVCKDESYISVVKFKEDNTARTTLASFALGTGDIPVYSPESEGTGSMNKDARLFLDYLFEVKKRDKILNKTRSSFASEVTDPESYYGAGLNIMMSKAENSSYFTNEEGDLVPGIYRAVNFYIDPDSPAFNATQSNLSVAHFCKKDDEEYVVDNHVYTRAKIDYERLIPYIIAYTQNFVFLLDEKIKANSAFQELREQVLGDVQRFKDFIPVEQLDPVDPSTKYSDEWSEKYPIAAIPHWIETDERDENNLIIEKPVWPYIYSSISDVDENIRNTPSITEFKPMNTTVLAGDSLKFTAKGYVLTDIWAGLEPKISETKNINSILVDAGNGSNFLTPEQAKANTFNLISDVWGHAPTNDKGEPVKYEGDREVVITDANGLARTDLNFVIDYPIPAAYIDKTTGNAYPGIMSAEDAVRLAWHTWRLNDHEARITRNEKDILDISTRRLAATEEATLRLSQENIALKVLIAEMLEITPKDLQDKIDQICTQWNGKSVLYKPEFVEETYKPYDSEKQLNNYTVPSGGVNSGGVNRIIYGMEDAKPASSSRVSNTNNKDWRTK